MIEVSNIYADPNFFGFFSYWHQIQNPFRMSYFEYNFSIQQFFHFTLNQRFQLWMHLPQRLLVRLDSSFNRDDMLYDLCVICFKLFICLSKHICVLFEQTNELTPFSRRTTLSQIYISRFSFSPQILLAQIARMSYES